MNPVGRTVGVDVPGYGPIPESFVKMQIVGVIRSERTSGLHAPPELVAYVPFAQAPRQDIKLVVRTASDPASLMPSIREAVRQIDPRLPLGDVMTMEQVKQQSMLWATQPTWVVGAFAGVAALLAALGLYGVLAHAVTQQRREIGIRMALGARPGDVLSYVLRNAVAMLIVGLAGVHILSLQAAVVTAEREAVAVDEPCAPLLLAVDEDLAVLVDLFEVEVAPVEQHLRVRLRQGPAGLRERHVVPEGSADGGNRFVERECARRALGREPLERRHLRFRQ